ncbi:MAG TPA: hypothetical protein VME41_01125 [Stellaceae bacterium]|nr:hypothetical protein [Stellaceae bacterium]
MAFAVEDTALRRAALEYVVALWNELAAQNAAPTLGLQNQAVDLILADGGLQAGVIAWAACADADEATAGPPRRLPQDALYRRVRAYMESVGGAAVLVAPGEQAR